MLNLPMPFFSSFTVLRSCPSESSPFQYPSRTFLSSRFRPIRGKPKMCVCIACPFLLLKLKSPRPHHLRKRRKIPEKAIPASLSDRETVVFQSIQGVSWLLIPCCRVFPQKAVTLAGYISYSGASATDLHRLPFLVCINQDFFI